VIIEAALADGHCAVFQELPKFGHIPLLVEAGGVVGVDAGGEEHEAWVLGRSSRG
jgi:hypothetical protein